MLPDLSSRPSGRLSGLSQSARWGRLGVTATVLCLFLAGCEIFVSEEPEPQRVATASTDGQEPNLGDVPSEAPQTSSQAARQQVREGLLADRSQARYTDETLTGEGLVGAAPGLTDPSAPATTRAAPSPPPFASLSGQGGAQSTARQSAQLGGSQATAQTSAQTTAQAAAPAATAAQAATSSAAQTSQTQAAQAQQRQVVSPTPQRQSLPQAQVPTTQQQRATTAAPQRAAAIPSPAPPPTTTPSLPPLPPGPPVLLGVIYFNHNSTALSQGDLQVLRQVVALQQQRGGVLRVVGHASQRTAQLDPRAHEQTNLQLSQRRADSVARALRGFGVRPDAVISEGRGDSEQLYHEFMPTGEAGNRRVEIFLQS